MSIAVGPKLDCTGVFEPDRELRDACACRMVLENPPREAQLCCHDDWLVSELILHNAFKLLAAGCTDCAPLYAAGINQLSGLPETVWSHISLSEQQDDVLLSALRSTMTAKSTVDSLALMASTATVYLRASQAPTRRQRFLASAAVVLPTMVVEWLARTGTRQPPSSSCVRALWYSSMRHACAVCPERSHTLQHMHPLHVQTILSPAVQTNLAASSLSWVSWQQGGIPKCSRAWR